MQDGLNIVNGRPLFDAQRQVSGRELRRHLDRLEALQQAQAEGVAAAGTVLRMLIANQETMKAHIEQLEQRQAAFDAMTFWQRLGLLFFGVQRATPAVNEPSEAPAAAVE